MNMEIKVYMESMDALRMAIRRTLEGVDAQCLNWNPLPGEANSLYAIVAHMCGSEAGMIHQRIAGQPIQRNPHEEFGAHGDDPQEICDRFDDVGNTTRSLMDGLTEEDLERSIDPGGGRPVRTIREWISMNLRHIALHLGHMEITSSSMKPASWWDGGSLQSNWPELPRRLHLLAGVS